MFLAHVEVLPEDLVTAPPIRVDHRNALVAQDLVRICIPNVVLVAVDGEASVRVLLVVVPVALADVPLPLLDHVLFLHLRQQVQHEALVEVEDQQSVCNAEAVLSREARQLPVGVTEWVLKEPGDVFVGSPSLGPVSRLVGLLNHLGEVAISLLGKGSEISEKYYLPANHVRSLHHIWVTVEETFDTCAPRLQR